MRAATLHRRVSILLFNRDIVEPDTELISMSWQLQHYFGKHIIMEGYFDESLFINSLIFFSRDKTGRHKKITLKQLSLIFFIV